jgi:FKBP-type peptidyl-prolyl cis-trans isomerase 2
MVRDGQTAKIRYVGTLDDGSVFDSSEGKEPLSFELGSGSVVPGLENTVRDMDVGETKTVHLDPRQAYGDVHEELIAIVPKERFPDSIDPRPGLAIQVQTEQGVLPARIVDVSDEGVRIDANHPLAGKELTFEVSLLEVA